MELVLLDLKLPKVDGVEVLRRIRNDERTRLLPIVVLTSSTNPRDRRSALRLQAAAFLTKPDDYAGMCILVKELSSYIFPALEGQASG